MYESISHRTSDQAGRRIVLYGTILSKPGILILERAPFASSELYLSSIPKSLLSIKNLGANDIYFWYMACSGHATAQEAPKFAERHEDLKINLIYPCTEQHLKKYSKQ